MGKVLKLFFATAVCMTANACSAFDRASNDIPETTQIPAQFHAVWVWDTSLCASTKPFPFIKLEAGGFSTPKPPYSTESSTFAVQKIIFDRPDGRHLRVLFASLDTLEKSSDVTLELSEDGKTMSWHERGAARSLTLRQCR